MDFKWSSPLTVTFLLQDQLFMHLTNYSINKKSENFERSEDVSTGHKRSIKYLNDYLRKNDHDVNAVWNRISVSITFVPP